MLRLVLMAFLVAVLSGCAVANLGMQEDPMQADNEEQSQPAPSTEPEPPEPDPTPQAVRADLQDLGEAPELNNEIWLNTESPLRLAGLRGKVVLLDMWTFG